MAALEHITPEQIAQYGVIAAPDRLTGRADDNKKIFDRLVRELVAVVVNEIIDKTNELLVDESVREKNEEERVAAELLRVEAEKLRVQAESQRVTNEDERVQAEAARVAAEALRVQAENLRVRAEQSRVDAEQERERAEAERESTTRGIVTQATEQANLAAQSANRASDYEQRSSESAREAADSESQARSYADSARLSSISAGNSETKAKESEDSAKDSAALATDALGKGPYINPSTKTWFVWDTRVGKFVDTGIKAEAKDGSIISATGLWGINVDSNGDLILTYVGDQAPPLSLDSNGDLIYTLAGNRIVIGNVSYQRLTSYKIIYVNAETGDDKNPGTSSKPFRTIQAALDYLPKDLGGYGVLISLAPGEYDEDVSVRGFFNRSEYNYLQIRGATNPGSGYPEATHRVKSISVGQNACHVSLTGLWVYGSNASGRAVSLSTPGVLMDYCTVKNEGGAVQGVIVGYYGHALATLKNIAVDGFTQQGIAVDGASVVALNGANVINNGVGISTAVSSGGGIAILYNVTYSGNTIDTKQVYGGQIFGG